MPRYVDEPITKITLNLFSKDVKELKEICAEGDYTGFIRDIVRSWLNQRRREDA